MLVVVFCAALLPVVVPSAVPLVAARSALSAQVPSTTSALPPATLAPLADGAAAARLRYLAGDFDGAVKVAAEVDAAFTGPVSEACVEIPHLSACQRGPAFDAGASAWDAWSDAQTTQALAHFRQGRDAEADAILRRLVAVRPTWSPDKGFVPPKQLARFEELRQALLAGPTVPLTLTGGSGAVVLDGRPVTRDLPLDVIPGRHYVGAAGVGQVIVVDAATRVAVGAALAPPASLPPPTAAATPEPDDGVDGWMVMAVGAGVVAVVTGAVVGVVLALQPRDNSPNPGGVTVFVDASLLNPENGATR